MPVCRLAGAVVSYNAVDGGAGREIAPQSDLFTLL